MTRDEKMVLAHLMGARALAEFGYVDPKRQRALTRLIAKGYITVSRKALSRGRGYNSFQFTDKGRAAAVSAIMTLNRPIKADWGVKRNKHGKLRWRWDAYDCVTIEVQK